MNPNSHFSRRSFIKTMGVAAVGAPFLTGCVTRRTPSGRLRHASFGASNMAWSDLNQIAASPNVDIVAICDVDLSRTIEARKKFPNAKIYQDWRELLDKEANNIDSVNVSVPDHMHAPIGISAMQLGKHLYGQKPLAHDLYEVRRMTQIARKQKVVTQMGIQVHSKAHYQRIVPLIQSGIIGKIKEVHIWSNKTWGDTAPLPELTETHPVPADFDWNLWLGVCAERPFIGGDYYHPENWRKRLDFGTGTFGDMGCHMYDPVFCALKLTAPISIRSEGPAPNPWNWALDAKIHYQFPGNQYSADKTLPITWYDGAQKPPAEIAAILNGKRLPDQGSVFIGTDGAVILPHYGRPQLFPLEKFKDYVQPEAPDENHWEQFVLACQGKGKTSTPFDYAGPLTETILLGGVASRFPQTTLRWDAVNLKFDLPAANQFVRRDYRKGWSVKGLS